MEQLNNDLKVKEWRVEVHHLEEDHRYQIECSATIYKEDIFFAKEYRVYSIVDALPENEIKYYSTDLFLYDLKKKGYIL